MTAPRLIAPASLGTPVVTARRWCAALAPNGSGGWNFITQIYELGNAAQAEWLVLKDLTGTPSQVNHYTPSGIFSYKGQQISNQHRAANGRIFFGGYQDYLWYYDPADQQIHDLGQVPETPPINPNASTTLGYSATFGPDQLLYLGTAESQYRQPMVCRVDPVGLTVTVLAYVGDSFGAYTTYAYYLAADTNTAAKYLYVAVGEDPWQLWAVNLTTLATTKLASVTAGTGGNAHIEFDQRPEGWTVKMDTDVGNPDNVVTTVWCVDGTTYPYTYPYNPSTLPFTPRDVTPYSNPLVNPPTVDNTGPLGTVRWQPPGGGAWTTVNYTTVEAVGVNLDSLAAPTDDLLMGEAEQYNGAIRRNLATGDAVEWLTPNLIMSQAVYPKTPGADGLIYMIGYPNGGVWAYDPAKPWDGGTTNPASKGQYYATSNMKYPYAADWAWGWLYCAGWRERTGTGSAIGRYDPRTGAFIGTYAGLSTLDPSGLYVATGVHDVVLSTNVTSGSAPLVIFDQDLNQTAQVVPHTGSLDAGVLYPVPGTSAIAGLVYAGHAYLFDLTNRTTLSWVDLPGAVTASCCDQDGTIWYTTATTLYRLDPATLTSTAVSTHGLGTVALLAWRNRDLYLTVGPTLYVMRGLYGHH